MAVELVSDELFAEKIKNNPKVVVKFFADWCGSCRLFAPKYKRLSNDERFADVLFLEVNAENNPEARKLANVNNLPTFSIFKDGQWMESLAAAKEELVVELMEKLN